MASVDLPERRGGVRRGEEERDSHRNPPPSHKASPAVEERAFLRQVQIRGGYLTQGSLCWVPAGGASMVQGSLNVARISDRRANLIDDVLKLDFYRKNSLNYCCFREGNFPKTVGTFLPRGLIMKPRANSSIKNYSPLLRKRAGLRRKVFLSPNSLIVSCILEMWFR